MSASAKGLPEGSPSMFFGRCVMCTVLGYCGKSGSPEACRRMLETAGSRGPDQTGLLKIGNGYLGFDRLAIMGLTEHGMQPFLLKGNACVCNGEIYGFRPLKE